MDNVANIGKSLQIKGELTGNEDLTVEGQVDGKIFLKDHKLTIGPNGRVKADLQAKSVIVSGKLDGNVTADDRVEITATGSMTGDVTAPRVVLADGARFKGSVDMEGKSGAVGASVSEIPRKTASAKA
jgi:cytoskeletal protein CcmA (bactofilin family)